LDQYVIDAVVHQVGADRVVPIRHERHFQLRPDAVGARHENRVAIRATIQAKQPSEGTDLGKHASRESRPRQRLDSANGLVSGVDIDARFPVVHRVSRLV
jgi:hypothetical protein